MYVVVIAWIYVVLMMSVAEATNTTGTVLGAMVTFALYGLLPVGLIVYLMGTPARGRANKQREQREQYAVQEAAENARRLAASAVAEPTSSPPDAGSHAPCGEVAVAAPAHAASVPSVGKIT